MSVEHPAAVAVSGIKGAKITAVARLACFGGWGVERKNGHRQATIVECYPSSSLKDQRHTAVCTPVQDAGRERPLWTKRSGSCAFAV